MEKEFHEIYNSALDTSRIAAEALNTYWLSLGVDIELIHQLELCTVEVVNNIFIHAYKKQDDLPIEIKSGFSLENEEKSLFISISDQGEAMNQFMFDKKLMGNFIEVDPMQETTWLTSGRGFLIVSHLMDRVELSVLGRINTLTMTKRMSVDHARKNR